MASLLAGLVLGCLWGCLVGATASAQGLDANLGGAEPPAAPADAGAEAPLGEAPSAESAAAFYEKALVAFNRGEARNAFIYLKNALQEDPLLLPAHLLLGRLYLSLGQGAEAERQLRVADGLGAHRSLIQNSLARAYLLQGRPQQVIDEMFPLGTSRDEDAELLALRGEAHLELGQRFDAQRAFTQAWEKNPKSVSALLGRVRLQLLQGEIEQAGTLVNEAVAIAPNNPHAWYLKGLLGNALGDYLGALEDFERSVKLLPAFLPAQIGRITILLRLNRLQQAAAVAEEVRGIYPNDPRSHYLTAVVAGRRGDAAGAEAALRDAMDLLAHLPQELIDAHQPSLLLAGLVSFNLKLWDQATDYLGRYLTQDPDGVGVRVLLARIDLEQRDRPERAIQLLEAATALAPDNVEAQSLLAEAYMRTGAHLKAAEPLRQALQRDGSDVVLRTQRAINDFGLGRHGTAIEELSALLEQRPENRRAGATLVVMLLQQRRHADAIDSARRLLLAEPANLTYANLFGSTLLADQRTDQARWAFAYALALDPGFFPARLNLAEALLAQNQPQLARDHLEQIIAAEPRETGALLLIARSYESEGDLNTALRYAEQAWELDPNALDGAVYRLGLLLRLQRPEEAAQLAESLEARSANTDDTELLTTMSRAYIATGRLAAAQIVLRRASSLAGYDARRLLRIALLQREAGEPEAAIWSLRKATSGEPDNLPARIRLAEMLIDAGRIQDALAEADALAEGFPTKPYAEHVRGLIARKQGDQAAAVKHFRTALALEPSPVLAIRLYESLAAAEGTTAAVAFLADWLAGHPDDGLAAQTLGLAYYEQGRLEDARRLLEQSLSQAPDNALVLNNLAMIGADTNDPQALEYARRAHQLMPNAAEIVDTLGWILVQRGELDEGLRFLRDAQTRAGRDDGGIAYHIAWTLNRLGRTEEAIEQLQQLLDSGQANPREQQRAKRLLQELRTHRRG